MNPLFRQKKNYLMFVIKIIKVLSTFSYKLQFHRILFRSILEFRILLFFVKSKIKYNQSETTKDFLTFVIKLAFHRIQFQSKVKKKFCIIFFLPKV